MTWSQKCPNHSIDKLNLISFLFLQGTHLSPLIVPQRKQSANRIPPAISTAAAGAPLQKASELKKQPNGQLPSKLR